MDCIFCKIIKNEIPAAKVYEDDDVLAFLDVAPLTKGHCLVIPKTHYENIFDIDQAALQKVIIATQHVAEKIKNILQADGIRLSQSNGKAAGQEVMHFHLHIIPRYQDDGIDMSMTQTSHLLKVNFKALEELALKINS